MKWILLIVIVIVELLDRSIFDLYSYINTYADTDLKGSVNSSNENLLKVLYEKLK